jgi:hypothetical protein
LRQAYESDKKIDINVFLFYGGFGEGYGGGGIVDPPGVSVGPKAELEKKTRPFVG